MIITDKFVLINYPKTGTTFARAAISAVYGVKNTRLNRLLRKLGIRKTTLRELKLPKLYGNYDPSSSDQHGVYRQIPEEDRGKRIVSIVRNPLQKYLSSYVYGSWKKHPPFSLDQVIQAFPGFPDISFPLFYDLLNHPKVNEDKLNAPEVRTIGSYTRMFLVFFSENPNSAASAIVNGEPLARVIPRITFLHQEALRDNLAYFLEEIGIGWTKTRRLYDLEEKNVGSKEDKSKISRDEIQVVSKKILSDESKLLEAFPEYVEQLSASIEDGSREVQTSGCAQPRTLGVTPTPR